MSFVKYHHVEKLGHDEVEDICEGVVTVYPKLDGTNASVWWGDDDEVHAGSRNRQLTLDNDNAGFFKWVTENDSLIKFMKANPNLRLYGEWLVPHTLKDYREEAWRRFWVFDVWDNNTGELVPAEAFREEFERFGIDYIMLLARIQHPTDDQLVGIMNSTNTFLMQDGAGPGEGIVLKRYDGWRNRYGRQNWAKMVRNEFKEKNKKEFDRDAVSSGRRVVEVDILDEFCTEALIKKELAKIVHSLANEDQTWEHHGSGEIIEALHVVMMSNRRVVIPRLLSTVFHALINEEMWAILKKFKNPTVDFRKLNRMVEQKVKATVPELF